MAGLMQTGYYDNNQKLTNTVAKPATKPINMDDPLGYGAKYAHEQNMNRLASAPPGGGTTVSQIYASNPGSVSPTNNTLDIKTPTTGTSDKRSIDPVAGSTDKIGMANPNVNSDANKTNAALWGAPTTPQANPLDKVSGYTPERRTVDTGTETVQGRIKGIIDEGSPLMRQAENRALQKMNSRGVLNSSMAIGAGQSALYDAALPIASQDATTYSDAAKLNQQYGNAAEQFGAGSANDAAMVEFQAQQDKQILDRQAEIEVQLQGIRGDQAKELASIEQEYGMLARTSEDATSALSTTNAAISAILSNPDIPAVQKDALVARQVELLRNNLSVIGSIGNVDLEGLLDYGGGGTGAPGTGGTFGGGSFNTDLGTLKPAPEGIGKTDLIKLGLRPDKLIDKFRKLF